MNLYLISQKVNEGCDIYDSAVVCAATEKEARLTHPDGNMEWDGEEDYFDWCAAVDVDVKLIGVADDSIEKGVVCSSFNAG